MPRQPKLDQVVESTVQVHLRLSVSVRNRLARLAMTRQTTMQDVMHAAIVTYLDTLDKETTA